MICERWTLLIQVHTLPCRCNHNNYSHNLHSLLTTAAAGYRPARPTNES